MSSILDVQRRARYAVLLLAAGLSSPLPALADVLPEQPCDVLGASCEGSTPSGPFTGTCRIGRCLGGGTGGSSITHECQICVPGAGGSAGTSGAAGSGASADAGSAGSLAEDADGECDCGLPGSSAEVSLSVLMLGLGLMALVGRRRQ